MRQISARVEGRGAAGADTAPPGKDRDRPMAASSPSVERPTRRRVAEEFGVILPLYRPLVVSGRAVLCVS